MTEGDLARILTLASPARITLYISHLNTGMAARGVEFREETSKLRPQPHLECAAICAGCQPASIIARHIP